MAEKFTDISTRIVRSSVDWSCAGLPLAAFLAGRFTYRSQDEWEKRIASGEITVNGKSALPEQLLQLHDSIEYRPQDIVEPPARVDYRVVYEDEYLMVIDKPGNLCIHPAGPFFKNTLWHLLVSKYGEVHFLNRLDRETSGLLIAARDKATTGKLSEKGAITAKHYQVIVHGDFTEPLSADGFLISAGGAVRKKRKFVKERPQYPPFESASTVFTPILQKNGLSLISAELGTGRMHQIRATLHSLGYPVVGDKLYGVDERFYLKQKDDSLTGDDRKNLLISRQALHCCALSFRHHISGEIMNFTSPLPDELQTLVE